RPGSTFWVCALKALQNSMMLRPRWPSAGPMGGEGFALPAGTCSLMKPMIFFATMALPGFKRTRSDRALPVSFGRETAPGHRAPPSGAAEKASGLLDLAEIQFHRGGAPEDEHRDPDLALLVVHFLDVAVEVRERPLRHADGLAHLEEDLGLGLLHALLHLVQDVLDFLLR